MALSDKSAAYLTQLAETCQTLFTSSVVQRKAPSLLSGSRQLWDYLRANQQCRPGFRLALHPNWKIEVLEPNIVGVLGRTELHFGGEIVFEQGSLVRQVLTVVILFRSEKTCNAVEGRPHLIAGENHVVRRFHFDFDRNVAGGCTPLAHVQIGGKLNPEYLDLPDDDGCRYELFGQLDCPRLPWTIAGLPTILDTFLRQFPTALEEVVAGEAWRRRVMDSERLWAMEYFRQAAEMMGSESNRECLYDYACTEEAFVQ